MIKVKGSSQVNAWNYDPVDQVLSVAFHCPSCKGTGRNDNDACMKCRGAGTSGVYRYSAVPPEVWGNLRGAESAGRAVNELVKKAGFKYEFVPNGVQEAIA